MLFSIILLFLHKSDTIFICSKVPILDKVEFIFRLSQSILALYLHLNKRPTIEAVKSLTIVNISKLIANNASIADCCIYVGVRVSKYPRIDTAVCDEVAQLRCEGTIQQVACMLWATTAIVGR